MAIEIIVDSGCDLTVQQAQQMMGDGVQNQQYDPMTTIQNAQERLGEQI